MPTYLRAGKMTQRKSRSVLWLALLSVGAGFTASAYWAKAFLSPRSAHRTVTLVSGTPAFPTFSRDLAPIAFDHCAACHHTGGSGPFELLTAADVRRHAKQIATVVDRSLMPPWLPDGERG